MGRKFKGKKISLGDFSKLPPPSPSLSTPSSTPSLTPRQLWENSPRSVHTDNETKIPGRLGGRLMMKKNKDERFKVPYAPSVPIPNRITTSNRSQVNLFQVDNSMKILNDACIKFSVSSINDNTERKKLTNKIEGFVDWIANQYVNNGSWLDENNQLIFHEDLCINRKTSLLCKKGVSCKLLPDHTVEKSFIPQLYHLLQDYDLFSIYMGIINNDEQDDINILQERVEDWAVDIGVKLGERNASERVNYAETILIKVKRIQFLREFDERCCRNKESNHEKMNSVLDTLYQIVKRYVERTRKNHGLTVPPG